MNPKSLFILLILVVSFQRCNEQERLPQFLSYHLSSEDIQKVEIGNINGKFILNKDQLTKFTSDFLKSKTVPGLRIKTGSLSIIITLINGNTFVARGNSKSEFLEISSQIATRNLDELENTEWLVLDTKGINYNNYRPR